eukprot:39920_1
MVDRGPYALSTKLLQKSLKTLCRHHHSFHHFIIANSHQLMNTETENNPSDMVNNLLMLDGFASNCKPFLANGYVKESNRLKDLDTQCPHYQFEDIESFHKHIHHLIQKQEKNIHDMEADQKFTKTICGYLGVGCCKQCSLWILSNIKQLLTWSVEAAPTSQNEFQFKLISSHDIWEQTENYVSCYFINAMYHHHAFRFMFRQSNIWISLTNQLNSQLLNLTINCQLESDKNKNLSNKTLHFDSDQRDILSTEFVDYKPVMLLLFQLLRNLKNIQQRNWEGIILCGHSFLRWLYFARQQLKSRMYLQHQFGYETMYCLAILICCALHCMSSNWRSWDVLMVKKFGFCGIKQWFNDITNIAIDYFVQYGTGDAVNIQHIQLLKTYALFKKMVYLNATYYKFMQAAKEVFELKWNNMQCQNQLCAVKRYNKKLRKCKLCKVARYCSTKCQKIDWKINKHSRFCGRLAKMRKENKRFWKQHEPGGLDGCNARKESALVINVTLSDYFPDLFV